MRGGIQQVGETVLFEAFIDLPQDTGGNVSAKWDFYGEGTFPLESLLSIQ